MKRLFLRRAATLILGFLSGCNAILGIEHREFIAPANEGCTNSLECDLGTFCTQGACSSDVPVFAGCQVLEPADTTDLLAYNWNEKPHVLGALVRINNLGEKPRLDAMRLAIREINANGAVGPAHTPIAMVACDYGGKDGTASGTEAKVAIDGAISYLSENLGARVVVAGSSSSATKTALDRILSRKLPVALLSSFSTSTSLTDYADKLPGSDVGLLWRTAPDDTQQAKVLAQLAMQAKDLQGDGPTKLGILYIDDTYGGPLNLGVATALGGKLPVKSISFPEDADQKVFEEKLDLLFKEQPPPDALLFVGIDGAMVVDAYQALLDKKYDTNLKFLFLADAAKEAQTLLASTISQPVKEMINRSFGTAPYRSLTPNYGAMADALLNDFGTIADDFSFLAQSYDAAYIASYGLVWASARYPMFDGEAVATGFKKLSSGDATLLVGPSTWTAATKGLTDTSPGEINISGTSGELDFDPTNGQTSGPMEIWRPNALGTGFDTCAVCEPDKTDCDLTACITTP